MPEFIEVHTTIDSIEEAQKLADLLVRDRLAACVQISGPIQSTYWWQGKIERAQEWMCSIKTCKEFYARLEQAIKDHHPYDVPEIIATDIIAGNQQYLDWIRDETR